MITGVDVVSVFAGGGWLPDPIGQQMAGLMTSWELFSSGGGRAKKIACSGSGDFSETGVTITLTRIDKPGS